MVAASLINGPRERRPPRRDTQHRERESAHTPERAAQRKRYRHDQHPAERTAQAGDIIVGMDTDFSHSPYDIPRFVEKVRDGFDMVVGSRYIQGGQYQVNSFQTLRKSIASRLGNILIHLISGVPVHDFTTALRAIRRDVVHGVRTESKGNSFFMEFIIKAYREGYSMTEIPIIFRDRVAGKSKLSLGKQSFKMVLDLLKLTHQNR